MADGGWGILYGWELAALAPAGNDSPDELFTTPLRGPKRKIYKSLSCRGKTLKATHKFRFQVEFWPFSFSIFFCIRNDCGRKLEKFSIEASRRADSWAMSLTFNVCLTSGLALALHSCRSLFLRRAAAAAAASRSRLCCSSKFLCSAAMRCSCSSWNMTPFAAYYELNSCG